MSETLDLEENQQSGLPVFLKVLCILTFVGTGLGIIGALYNIFAFDFTIKQLENQQEMLSSGFNPLGDMSGLIEATKKWGMISYFLTLAGNILCLIAALMMWKLKKIGFFIYIFGQILPMISAILISSSIKGGGGSGFMNMASSVGIIITGIFVTAFIIMYAVNFKHLK